MTSPTTSPAAARSRRATWAAYGLFAAAVAVLLITRFVLVDEHVREDRDGSIDYWTTYPFGEAAADAAINLLAGLGIAGVLALTVAAFIGPAPSWWRRPSEETYRSGTVLLLGYATIVTVIYVLWSLPFLGYDDDPFDTWTLTQLAIGVIAAAAAVRARSWAVSVPLGLVAAVLLNNSTGEASIILIHGALAILLGYLVLLVLRTDGWARGLAIVGFGAGVLLWLWLLLLISLFVTCEYTGGCLS